VLGLTDIRVGGWVELGDTCGSAHHPSPNRRTLYPLAQIADLSGTADENSSTPNRLNRFA